MARKTKRAKLHLTDERRVKLKRLGKSRKAPLREVQRTGILLRYADKMPVTQIQKPVNASRPAIYRCIGKASAACTDAGLKDFYHRPFEPEINEAAKAWVVNSACTGPEDHGLAAELRILNGPAKYTRSHAPPKHGSWLNLTETVFSKMARTFLRHIRVSGKEELKERILRGIKEITRCVQMEKI